MNSWSQTRDAFRTRLWPIPTIAVVAALVLGLVVPEIDATYDDRMSGRLSSWLFGGDADAARSLLGSISSSLITVTGLTFSLTVVSLQLASSQFSPRLLRTFTRDLFVQVTLALFLATFTYSLTVLRAVRGSDDEASTQLVPKIAVTLAFVLAIASVLGLVLFLSHLTKQLRVETMLSHVHRDALATMRSVLPPRDRRDGDGQGERDGGPDPSDDAPTPVPPSYARSLVAVHDGFLTGIDHEALRSLAVEEGAVLELDVDAGTFLVQGTPLGRAWALDGGAVSNERFDRLAEKVNGCIDVGVERTSAQDVGFGLRQLTDVANKALSPGINDPTTAMHALGHVSVLLCELSERDLGAERLLDEDGRVRVVLHRADLASYVDLGISQPRRYGAADPQVLQKIFRVLLDLARRVAPEQRTVVRHELQRLRATVEAQAFGPAERAGLDASSREVEDELDVRLPQGH